MAFDWNQIRAFLAVVEEGSFSAAAKALKTTQPTISRQIAALEESLGVTLFERNSRTMTLTQIGHDLRNSVQAMGEAAAQISMTAVGGSQDLSGEVSITATDWLSSLVLPSALAKVREAAPAVTIRVIATNSIQNLTRHEADIAIRHTRPAQADLFAKHVGDFHGGIYASASYLNRAGRPSSAAELSDHVFVGDPEPDLLLAPLEALGAHVDPQNFAVVSDNNSVAWDMAKAGHGMTVFPDVIGDGEPTFERVLPGLEPWRFPAWLVAHRELKTNKRIRLVFNALADHLSLLLRRP